MFKVKQELQIRTGSLAILFRGVECGTILECLNNIVNPAIEFIIENCVSEESCGCFQYI